MQENLSKISNVSFSLSQQLSQQPLANPQLLYKIKKQKSFYPFPIPPMKDYIKRITVIILFGAFLLYLLYLLIQWQKITTVEYANLNVISYILLIALAVYIIALYGIYPLHIKFSRPALLVVGLALIIFSQTIFANNGAEGIFIGDIFSVVGVMTLVLFPTNVLTTDKVKKYTAKKNEVIIEV